jgi:hypothetical protein
MFAELGNLFLRQMREAESTDARLDIKRHDPDQEKRGAKKQGDTDSALNEDDTSVSIEALSLFLVNFLKSLQTGPAEALVSRPDPADLSPQAPSRALPASQAADAYAATARAFIGGRETPVIEYSAQAKAADGLSTQEIRDIYGLLDDLKALSSRDVRFLKIEPGANFLQSLIQAVRKIKEPPVV